MLASNECKQHVFRRKRIFKYHSAELICMWKTFNVLWKACCIADSIKCGQHVQAFGVIDNFEHGSPTCHETDIFV